MKNFLILILLSSFLTIACSKVRESAGVRQLIEDPEIIQSIPERHSKKPDIVRNRIVELCGDIPRIELFARETAEGWTSWGNELEVKV